jgi:HSF-type DNA-binding
MSDSEDGSRSGSPIPPILLDEENNEGGNTLYRYRDFSTMPEEADAEEDSNANQKGSLESSIRVQKFPVKLYAILAQKEFHDIIAWMPHGRSWKVLKPNLFESMVMPLFFEYSNYHSFNRLVNAWSFRRISSGPDRGSYYHEVSLIKRTE